MRVTISRGGNASYHVAISSGAGFSGTVTLSVSGLPKLVTGKFTPASVVNAGTATLILDSKKNVPPGTYLVIVTGTSGNRVHSTSINLIVQ